MLKDEAAAPAKGSPLPAGTTVAVRVDGREIAAILRENREKFVSDAVVEKGKSREQAELEFDLGAEAVGLLREGRVLERVSGDALELSLDGLLQPVAKAARTEAS
jgi:hypothetical protein